MQVKALATCATRHSYCKTYFLDFIIPCHCQLSFLSLANMNIEKFQKIYESHKFTKQSARKEWWGFESKCLENDKDFKLIEICEIRA